MIAQYIEGPQRTWDILLPEISLAINSSASDGTHAAFSGQGREPRLLYEDITPSAGQDGHDTISRA